MRWWRLFIDKITGKGRAEGVVGPRRRENPRFSFETPLTARCSSWPKFVELFTGDISAGGLYIPTDRLASIGEKVEVDLALPDDDSVKLTGVVVHIIDAAAAERVGKRPGLGVKLTPPQGEARDKFVRLFDAARAAAPEPADVTDGNPEPRRPRTTPSAERHEDSLAEPLDLDEAPDLIVEEAEALPAPKKEQAMPPPPPGVAETVSFKAPQPAGPPPPKRVAPPAYKSKATDPIVGIDLGTTYTSVAAVTGKKVSILPWPDGAKSWASVVSFPKEHECLVGTEARKRLATDPQHTIASPKRLLGRKYDDIEIQSWIGQAPYRTMAGPDKSVVVELWGQEYAVTQLCAYIVDEARRVAETALGKEVRRCIMTVPVSFDDERARIFRRAGELARLEVVAMIDEPSAAALANRFDPSFGGIVGVYDFGGGTFDFSVVDVSKGDFQVLATAGDTWLGGDDFDTVLADAAANQFWRLHKVDLRKQAVEWQKLVFACERAKRMLSVDAEAAIFVPDVLRSATGMVDLNISLDRATFERATRPVIDRSLATCDEALELLGMRPRDLTTVYLSGGTTYVPAVREALSRHFAVPIRTGVPPEHAVCLGAAIHAAQIQYSSTTTLDAR